MKLERFAFELSTETISGVRVAVLETCRLMELDTIADLTLVEIALGEVLQNIVRYAFANNDHKGKVEIQVGHLGEIAAITVLDHSDISIADNLAIKKGDSSGGFGIGLIQSATQGMFVRRCQSANRFSLYFSSKHEEIPRESITWAGRVIESRLEGYSLSRLAQEVVKHQGISDYGHLVETATAAIEAWESHSESVPLYHNMTHFRDVLIAVDHLCDLHDEHHVAQRASLILSALLHDFKHPGSRVIEGFDSIETYSESEIRSLYSSESLTTSERNIIDEVCEIVLSTHDPKATIYSSQSALNSLFNVADSSASFIPWLGESISEQILDELGESETICLADFYRGFIDAWREIECPPEAAVFTAWIHPDRSVNSL